MEPLDFWHLFLAVCGSCIITPFVIFVFMFLGTMADHNREEK